MPTTPTNDENNQRHGVYQTWSAQQKTNIKIVRGQCYGLGIEWILTKLAPETDIFRLKQILPKMPIVKENEYNDSINNFIPFSKKIAELQKNQIPFFNLLLKAGKYTIFGDFCKIYPTKLYDYSFSGISACVDHLNDVYQKSGTHDQACLIVISNLLCGHAMAFKKIQMVEFFSSILMAVNIKYPM